MAERIAAAVTRKPAKYDAAAIGLAVGAVIDKHKMKKHFALDIADGRFAFRRRGDEIAAEARLDGIYVVRTSVPVDKVGSEQAVAAYKSLALVERAFRTLKGVDMQVRPIYHWLSTRVKAHVFLCMLAYYVEHHMRVALASLLFGDVECEVLLHFVLVDHCANREPDRSGIVLGGLPGDRSSDTLELTLC